jgi:hypothetical protein
MAFRNRRKPLDKQIKRSVRRAGFSIIDLAAWLDQPYPSVARWLDGTVPRSHTHQSVQDRLHLLDWTVDQGLDLPREQGEDRRKKIRGAFSRARRAYIASGHPAR